MRINFYGGPGAGKSTMAAQTYAWMKQDNYSVGLVAEYIKRWVYQERKRGPFDNIYICGKQLNEEYELIKGGVEHVVTDSPLFMQIPYCIKYQTPDWGYLEGIAQTFEEQYPSIHIHLIRPENYESHGRWETAEEAIQMDKDIFEYVNSHVSLKSFFVDRPREIYRFIQKELEVRK